MKVSDPPSSEKNKTCITMPQVVITCTHMYEERCMHLLHYAFHVIIVGPEFALDLVANVLYKIV